MSSNQRAARVAEEMRGILAQLIRDEVKDPRIGFVSIVKVEVSNDISHAKIYVSVLGDDKQKKDSLRGLTSASGFMRSEIARRLQLRYTPELHFLLDESIEHGQRIAKLLVEVQREQKEKEQEGKGE
ncbi:MAG: 30S ribosome-binding factor RbfA [Bacillota bacterium]